jgi:mRNA interferase RelE/StbE
LAWTIRYTDSALKQLRKLDRSITKRLLEFMDERVAPQSNPRSVGHALTGPLEGAYWRYRVGDYRIICDIQDAVLCVLVIKIGHRKEVYR